MPILFPCVQLLRADEPVLATVRPVRRRGPSLCPAGLQSAPSELKSAAGRVTNASPRGVLCVEQLDACLYCVGREGEAAFLETFQSQPRVCDPEDPEGVWSSLHAGATLCLAMDT